jgi:WD40 repeat protein
VKGWVTFVQYWGPNTIVSASTDRSVALWDTRVRNSPLFTLRHHYAPVSDVLVGPRTDPVMISAASDGTVVAWDFRLLGNNNDSMPSSSSDDNTTRRCQVVRSAAAKLYLHDFSTNKHVCGPIKIAKGYSRDTKSVLCVGSDSIVREWDVDRGAIVSEFTTGHCDTVSSLVSLQNDKVCGHNNLEVDDDAESSIASITASWDGTIRMRSRVRL